MQVLFTKIFACCLRSPSRHESHPNEQTPLIPPIEYPTPPSIYNENIVDRQRAYEQLDGIVRSKHVKMVDVLTAMPFNLRNASSSDRSHASSSRSKSTSDILHRRPSISMSRSQSSSPYPDASSSSIGLGTNELTSEPIFNARLIRRSVLDQKAATRGRLRKRKDHPEHEETASPPTKDGNPVSTGETPIDGIQQPETNELVIEVENSQNEASPDKGDIPHEDTPHQRKFHIDSVGELSSGWDD